MLRPIVVMGHRVATLAADGMTATELCVAEFPPMHGFDRRAPADLPCGLQ